MRYLGREGNTSHGKVLHRCGGWVSDYVFGNVGGNMNIGKLELVEIKENEDGSAVYAFEVDEEASKTIAELGLKLILFCGIFSVDIEDVFNWILENKDD